MSCSAAARRSACRQSAGADGQQPRPHRGSSVAVRRLTFTLQRRHSTQLNQGQTLASGRPRPRTDHRDHRTARSAGPAAPTARARCRPTTTITSLCATRSAWPKRSKRPARPGPKKRPGRNCTTFGRSTPSWNGWATACSPHFGRHRAPVLQSQHLHPDEQAFILMGLVPNRKGQPLLVEWQVATRRADSATFSLEPFDSFIAARRSEGGRAAQPRPYAEPRRPTSPCSEPCRSRASDARPHGRGSRPRLPPDLNERLRGTLADLERLQGRRSNSSSSTSRRPAGDRQAWPLRASQPADSIASSTTIASGWRTP